MCILSTQNIIFALKCFTLVDRWVFLSIVILRSTYLLWMLKGVYRTIRCSPHRCLSLTMVRGRCFHFHVLFAMVLYLFFGYLHTLLQLRYGQVTRYSFLFRYMLSTKITCRMLVSNTKLLMDSCTRKHSRYPYREWNETIFSSLKRQTWSAYVNNIRSLGS